MSEENNTKPKVTKLPKAARKRAIKKKKAGPKRGLSAYMYFSNSVRDTVKAEHPELTFGELAKAIGERWNTATDDVKAPFNELAAKDKERYQAEKAAFDANALTTQ